MKDVSAIKLSNRYECWDGTATMPVVFDDGGRKAAGYKGQTDDCVCRAIAIATGKPYSEVYGQINDAAKRERPRNGRRSSARTGVKKATIRRYIESLGWTWVPTMQIGSGCRVHLCDGELPQGRLIVNVSKHSVAVIDGVIYDTHDPQRATIVHDEHGERIAHRCVYGYYQRRA